jgi:hypothetical protein
MRAKLTDFGAYANLLDIDKAELPMQRVRIEPHCMTGLVVPPGGIAGHYVGVFKETAGGQPDITIPIQPATFGITVGVTNDCLALIDDDEQWRVDANGPGGGSGGGSIG